jgi:carbon storage regulator
MLILSRKKSETIKIGPNIQVTVLSVGNGRVKIGIEAPDQVRVLRGEIAAEPEPDLAVAPEHAWNACCSLEGQISEAGCLLSY